MQASDILFLDEIHMLPVFAREHLLTVMEDFKLSISMEDKDKGVLELSVPPFTVIGATTRQGVLDGPLRSRFKNIVRLRSYTIDEMHEVCTWIGDRNDVSFTDESLARLSKVASGMARRAVNIIDACIDTICVKTGKPIIKGESVIAPEILDETLKRLGYVGDLDANEYRYMLYLYNNKTCSLRTLASALEEQPSTIEEVYEAGLIRDGLVHVSTTGRQLTEKGIKLFHDEKIGI
jgi:Holliday junction DNA helicase RuvB